MNINELIGRNVRTAMKRNRMTNADLGKVLGLRSRQSATMICNGQRPLKVSELFKLAIALDCSPMHLLDANGVDDVEVAGPERAILFTDVSQHLDGHDRNMIVRDRFYYWLTGSLRSVDRKAWNLPEYERQP